MKKVFLMLIFLLPYWCSAQNLLYPWSQTNQLKVVYENDLFARTDRYYTQGLECGIHKIEPKDDVNCSFKRIEISQDVFTPSTIKSDSILIDDRPYAATIKVNLEYGLLRASKHSYLLGAELGIIGPLAGGKQMQTGIHKATHNFLPLGWQHQINHGIIFDLYGKLEKNIISLDSIFRMNLGLSSKVGTFQSNVSPSFTIIVGRQESAKVTLVMENSIFGIFYDGTLQGSLIGKQSEFVLNYSEMKRLVAKSELTLLFKFKNIGAQLSYVVQSPTFKEQITRFHAWGGIQVNYFF